MDVLEARRTTFVDLAVLFTAQRIKEYNTAKDIHTQAFVNQTAKATKRNGKSRYRTFNDFFDSGRTFELYLRPREETIEEKESKDAMSMYAEYLRRKRKEGE